MADTAEEEEKTSASRPPQGMRDNDEAMILSLVPSVNWTPVGNVMVPVPYNIVEYAGHDGFYASSVRFGGDPAMVLRSHMTHVHGDEAGTGGGLLSGTCGGIVEPIGHEPTVRAEGSPIIRHGDRLWMNNRNTIGEAVYINSVEVNRLPRPRPKPTTDEVKRAEPVRVRVGEQGSASSPKEAKDRFEATDIWGEPVASRVPARQEPESAEPTDNIGVVDEPKVYRNPFDAHERNMAAQTPPTPNAHPAGVRVTRPSDELPIVPIASDGTPGNNQAQNKQFRSIVRELGLTKDQQKQLHREISGQNMTYAEIKALAIDLFGN